MTASFNFLHPVPSFENNIWMGYVARSVPESHDTQRVTRMVYEHLGTALPVARRAGLVTEEEVPPFHRRLLRAGEVFL